MAEVKKTFKDLDQIADRTREIFQDLLRAHVQDKNGIEHLANVLGKTSSLVKKMLYKGDGGLDVWAKALAYIYKLDEKSLKTLRDQLRRGTPLTESDKVWFSIRDELHATEDEARYLAECAKQAFLIKTNLETVKKRRSSKT